MPTQTEREARAERRHPIHWKNAHTDRRTICGAVHVTFWFTSTYERFKPNVTCRACLRAMRRKP